MFQHTCIQVQFQGFFKGMRPTAFIASFLQHAEDPVIPFDMVVGALDIFPTQKDDHLLKPVSGKLLECPCQKRVGLIVGIVDQAGAATTCRLLANAFFKQPIELLVEQSIK